jgi:hypothetical protein
LTPRHSRQHQDQESNHIELVAPPTTVRVFGAIPLPAQHFQPRPVSAGELRRVLGGKGRAALVALPGARGAGKSQLAADAYRSAGRPDEAIALLQQVLADCERVLSLNHPLTTTVRDNLALARRSRDRRQSPGPSGRHPSED